MASGDTAAPSKAELRRQRTLNRREQAAAEVLDGQPTGVVLRTQSFAARTITQALPRELLDSGLITFRQDGRPFVAEYDPSLLAKNPQRGRLLDEGLAELAASLNIHGQQQPIIARLVTPTDRERWPDAFQPTQILMILHGHRVFMAQPLSKLEKFRVEVMMPEEGESDLEYVRRGLHRASIKMMHSQSYNIFDKVNLFMIWRQEFALKNPKDTEVAKYFEISKTEAIRVKAVSELDEGVKKKMLKLDRKPADEVIVAIASRPAEEQNDAFTQYGHLTVAALRRLQQVDKADRPASATAAPGRPRNYTLSLATDDSAVTSITTMMTPQQWKRRGGARAFWLALRKLSGDKQVRERVTEDLGP